MFFSLHKLPIYYLTTQGKIYTKKAFLWCSNLTEIHFHTNNIQIKDISFTDSALKELHFFSCFKFKKLIILKKRHIAPFECGAFIYCKSLESIKLYDQFIHQDTFFYVWKFKKNIITRRYVFSIGPNLTLLIARR